MVGFECRIVEPYPQTMAEFMGLGSEVGKGAGNRGMLMDVPWVGLKLLFPETRHGVSAHSPS